ncbi:hypothetical protein SBOR_1032 [Sclerotinia borealis F-4128]|uniref:Uncharacterized protein n=1 Tax=Sclerotinia borealis (strain F-4128) TaxID=1432307 RepID=W9CP33_SCLBF|nr:hypothetical protein SBOR_1032 [Sclerotinia borealis F-4128]
MSTIDPPDDLERGTPPLEGEDPLTRPPDSPPTPPGRDNLTPTGRAVEEALDDLTKQPDYEDIHGPGTSQTSGSTWKYVPSTRPNSEFDPSFENVREKSQPILDDRAERILREVRRDFADRMRAYDVPDSDSSASPEEEMATDIRSFVEATRRKDAREHAKNHGKSEEAEEEEVKRFDIASFNVSQRKRRARKEAKAKRKAERKEKLNEEILAEWARRLGKLAKEEESEFSTSESEGRDPPKAESKIASNLGKGVAKNVAAPTETTHTKVHWLDALDAQNLAPADYQSRLDEKIGEYDNQIGSIEEEGRKEETGSKATPSRCAEARAALRQQIKRMKAKLQGPNQEQEEHLSRQREEMLIQREYDEAFYRNQAAMDDLSSGDESVDARDERNMFGVLSSRSSARRRPIQNEPNRPRSLPEQLRTQSEDTKRVDVENDSDNADSAGAGAALNISSYAGGRRPFHNEPERSQDSSERLRKQREDSKRSNAKDDDANDSSDSAGTGAGAALHKNPHAGERRTLHSEPSSAHDSSKQPQKENKHTTSKPSGDEQHGDTKSEKPSVPKVSQTYPVKFPDVGVHDSNSRSQEAVWSWKRMAIIILTGMLLGILGVHLRKYIDDRWYDIEDWIGESD